MKNNELSSRKIFLIVSIVVLMGVALGGIFYLTEHNKGFGVDSKVIISDSDGLYRFIERDQYENSIEPQTICSTPGLRAEPFEKIGPDLD